MNDRTSRIEETIRRENPAHFRYLPRLFGYVFRSAKAMCLIFLGLSMLLSLLRPVVALLWGRYIAVAETNAAQSLLGAAGLWDIGHAFPDTDPAYAGISSLLLLERVMEMLHDKGLRVGNVDATILAQRPKLAAYIPAMRQALARTMGVDEARVNVKATTEEGLGFTGRGEGMAAHAVALLEEN